MFSQERQIYIKKEIEKNGAVTTSALMEHFGVSVETVRRDLLSLEREGFLKKVHGGAVRCEQMRSFHELPRRHQENHNEKEQLARTAVRCINENDVIGIDSGSTAVCLAREIRGKFSSLTVVTHSLDVFSELQGDDNIRVILCGGEYLPNERSFFGPLTESALDNVSINKMFLCPSAVSLKFGICDWHNEMYAIQKKMKERSDSIYVMADSSKFETKALMKIDDVKICRCFITDNALPLGIKELYAENGLNIITE